MNYPYYQMGSGASNNASGARSKGSSSPSLSSTSSANHHHNQHHNSRDIRHQLERRNDELDNVKRQLNRTKKLLEEKDAEIERLENEIQKLLSVLRETNNVEIEPLLRISSAEQKRQAKLAVSGETWTPSNTATQVAFELVHHKKDLHAKQLIKEAILDNDFLKQLEPGQVSEIVECMYERRVACNDFICKQGEAGNALYVLVKGSLEVIQDGRRLGVIKPGRIFGELAILYNCSRTASIQALDDGKLWALDRNIFKTIMMKSGLERQDKYMKYLEKVEVLERIGKNELSKIADVLEEDFYYEGEYIIREGERGDTFFIINEGQVRIEKQSENGKIIELNRLGPGKYFGEKALLSEDYRTASVVVITPTVVVLTVDRADFKQLIGDLNELREQLTSRRYDSDGKGNGGGGGIKGGMRNNSMDLIRSVSPPTRRKLSKFKPLQLTDLQTITTLGVGGFGRVELVITSIFPGESFALKCLKKKHIVDTRQQEHVKSEKRIMFESDSRFIAQLYKTFRDKKYVYFLMEVCLGGELWTVLRIKGTFDDSTARFCVACVLEAFEYLHGKNIVYRDLKPENLLIDTYGFIKLVDFGFAKRLSSGKKTWTFCGTPEYVAPEIILNKGHDLAADYWAIGVLIYELLTGNPPFVASDPMKIYNIILEGIEKIDMPKKIGRNSNNLIHKLCRLNPIERLGYGRNGLVELRKHRWFQGFDWGGLKAKNIPIPKVLKPCINGPTDTSVFDTYDKDKSVPEDEVSGWDDDF